MTRKCTTCYLRLKESLKNTKCPYCHGNTGDEHYRIGQRYETNTSALTHSVCKKKLPGCECKKEHDKLKSCHKCGLVCDGIRTKCEFCGTTHLSVLYEAATKRTIEKLHDTCIDKLAARDSRLKIRLDDLLVELERIQREYQTVNTGSYDGRFWRGD